MDIDLAKNYKDHLKNIYDIGKQIRSKILPNYSLMNTEMKRTYDDFIKDNMFYLFQYFIKMTITEKNTIVQDTVFIEDIKNIKLCHYTSLDTLKKIIANKNLKFNSLSNMNDSSEGEILFNFLLNLLKNDSRFTGVAEKEINKIKEKTFNDIFSFSFTSEYDDASQWDRYTDRDTGVCLISTIDKIGSLTIVTSQSNPCSFSYGPIYYVNSEQDEYNHVLNCQLFATPAATHGVPFATPAATHGVPFATPAATHGVPDILSNLSSNSAFIKCLSFKNEKEFRIAIERTKSGSDQLFEQGYADNLCPYVFLKLEELSKYNNNKNFFEMLFDEIMIGPQSKIKEENLKRFLAQNNINNIKVTKSNSKLKR